MLSIFTRLIITSHVHYGRARGTTLVDAQRLSFTITHHRSITGLSDTARVYHGS